MSGYSVTYSATPPRNIGGFWLSGGYLTLNADMVIADALPQPVRQYMPYLSGREHPEQPDDERDADGSSNDQERQRQPDEPDQDADRSDEWP